MTSDFGVTAGHVEYSNRRFDFDTRHMVMIEVYRHTETLEQFDYELPVYDRNEPYRARLFLTDEEYKSIRRMELNGVLRILHHANVVGGYCHRRSHAAGCLCEGQKCEKVPQEHGIRLRPVGHSRGHPPLC